MTHIDIDWSDKIFDVTSGIDVTMPEIQNAKRHLVSQAIKRDPALIPCKRQFSIYSNVLSFWYNDKHDSTRIVSTEIVK